jgi:DNA-binding transcriptional LysR family regulator
MQLNQLESFYQIVKTGSFSKASDNLLLTQSAVSHQIRNLEKELQIKLFDRLGNVVKLTEAGRTFFNLVDTFLNDLDNLKRVSEDINRGTRGHLTIATSHVIIKDVLPDVLRQFMSRFPGIKFNLFNRSLTSELIPMVLAGEVDLVIGAKLKQTLHPKLNFVSWKSFDKFLLVPKGHPLSKKRNIHLADLIKFPLILFREGSEVRRSVEDVFARHGFSFTLAMEIDVAENVEPYVEMGVGISVLSSINLKGINKRRLKCVNVTDIFGRVEYGIYFRSDRYITAAMKQFMEVFLHSAPLAHGVHSGNISLPPKRRRRVNP